jgi:hypothetical protein
VQTYLIIFYSHLIYQYHGITKEQQKTITFYTNRCLQALQKVRGYGILIESKNSAKINLSKTISDV